GIECNHSDLVERHSEALDTGSGHRIVAADQQRQLMDGGTHPNCLGDRAGCFLDRKAADLDVAAIHNLRRKLSASLEVVASNPAKGLAKQRGSQIASSSGYRS